MSAKSQELIGYDNLPTFEEYLKFQGYDPDNLTSADRDMWRETYDIAMHRAATTPKAGPRKRFRRVRGQPKYAVAIDDRFGLWLTLWVRCNQTGEIFIVIPRGDRTRM